MVRMWRSSAYLTFIGIDFDVFGLFFMIMLLCVLFDLICLLFGV